MWVKYLVEHILSLGLAGISIYLLKSFFDTFFFQKGNRYYIVISYFAYAFCQFSMPYIQFLTANQKLITTTILTILVSVLAYQGTIWKKCVFSFLFNAIWMLLEILSGYFISFWRQDFLNQQILGSLSSKMLLAIMIFGIGKVFEGQNIRELPVNYSFMLLLIPVGSIFTANTIFHLSLDKIGDIMELNTILSIIIVLGINVLIFRIYMKLAEEFELKKNTTVYLKQLELYEMYGREKEINITELREAKHDMKNNLLLIRGYAEKNQNQAILDFIDHFLEKDIFALPRSMQTGNPGIDSIITYKRNIAQKKGIDIQIEMNIPMLLPFNATDIAVVLGNIFDNAIEATTKLEPDKRRISFYMKYDKGNLLISILNTYDGWLNLDRKEKLLTRKDDKINHGMGMDIVRRVVNKYHGTVQIKHTNNEFLVKLILYGQEELLHE